MKTEKQLTAVEFLIEQLEGDDAKIAMVIGLKKYNSIIKEAIEMEKEQSYSEEEEKFKECYFIASTKTSSATICESCGKEKFLHKP